METAWVILADYAEIINGKLYIMGGGWDTLRVSRPDRTHLVGIAVAFRVPWNETNQVHHVALEVTDDDAGPEILKIEADLEVGRPVGLPLGASQVVQLALNGAARFDRDGGHVVVVRIEGQESARFPFRVFGPPVSVLPS
jgi:hypothetical protein